MRYALCLLIVVDFGVDATCQEISDGKKAASVQDEPLTYYVPEGLTTPKHLRFEQPSQLGPYCGPNSLYLLLRLENIPVVYNDMVKRIKVDSQGCSLAELQEIGESYGLRLDACKLTLEELYRLNPPYILHINTPAESSEQPTGARDHFVVVTRREPGENLVGIDPNSGTRAAWSRAFLSRNFSGYVLTPRQASTDLTVKVVLGVVLLLLTICNLILVRRKPR